MKLPPPVEPQILKPSPNSVICPCSFSCACTPKTSRASNVLVNPAPSTFLWKEISLRLTPANTLAVIEPTAPSNAPGSPASGPLNNGASQLCSRFHESSQQTADVRADPRHRTFLRTPRVFVRVRHGVEAFVRAPPEVDSKSAGVPRGRAMASDVLGSIRDENPGVHNSVLAEHTSR